MQDSYTQLLSSGILSLALCGYALTMPACPVNKSSDKQTLAEAFGLKAFSLFKDSQFAIFFIFSMLLGASLQILSYCDACVFMRGWDTARGCRIEHAAAIAYGLEVWMEDAVPEAKQ